MPDVLGEWLASSEHITELKALGRWLSRIYTRKAPIASVEVNLMEGSGPGTLFVPEGEVAANDAPIGFSSTYETLNVAGHRGILERGEITGQALAISLSKDRTLTLETKSLSREEFLDFAEKLTAALGRKLGVKCRTCKSIRLDWFQGPFRCREKYGKPGRRTSAAASWKRIFLSFTRKTKSWFKSF